MINGGRLTSSWRREFADHLPDQSTQPAVGRVVTVADMPCHLNGKAAEIDRRRQDAEPWIVR
ncbi:hypothetical protein RLDS_13115 [Sphingobium lactosutens DS20]|uniref:Uncharacterized protein n=1 Tax=Sphingobium lactosutens DS20 TaxID=1331060 RepID=T0IS51_9SPHN|nr:hypothetical protein RLDS_13115 [Sphingobium lactosutens DS20]